MYFLDKQFVGCWTRGVKKTPRGGMNREYISIPLHVGSLWYWNNVDFFVRLLYPPYMASIFSRSFQMIFALDSLVRLGLVRTFSLSLSDASRSYIFLLQISIGALSRSFFQMTILHRSGKRFTVYFIWKSTVYSSSIVLKLLTNKKNEFVVL